MIIKDAVFSGSNSFTFLASPETTDATREAKLDNVTFDKVYTHFYCGAIWFVNCAFENIIGASAIDATISKLTFEGNNVFRNNTSPLIGGAISLHESSMCLEPYAHVLFENNHADYAGGAIYIAPDPHCFFQLSGSLVTENHPQVDFIGNTASFAGSSLYGNIRNCSQDDFYAVFNIANTEADPSAIASDPYQVCLCENGKSLPNCSIQSDEYDISAFPGQLFLVRLAVVGAGLDSGVVPGPFVHYSSLLVCQQH